MILSDSVKLSEPSGIKSSRRLKGTGLVTSSGLKVSVILSSIVMSVPSLSKVHQTLASVSCFVKLFYQLQLLPTTEYRHMHC